MVELWRVVRLSMASMLRGPADFGQERGRAYASSEVGEDESGAGQRGGVPIKKRWLRGVQKRKGGLKRKPRDRPSEKAVVGGGGRR